MGRSGFRIVPKMAGNIVEFYLVLQATNETRKIGMIEVPHDNQINDNLELAQEVCRFLSKRIRKSV